MAEIRNDGMGGSLFAQVDFFTEKMTGSKRREAYQQEGELIKEEIQHQISQADEKELQKTEEGLQKNWEKFVVYSREILERLRQIEASDNDLFFTPPKVEKETEQEPVSEAGSGNPAVNREEVTDKNNEEWVPYGHLVSQGVINYHGVIFQCDWKEHAICLGDMTNKENVLTIPLSGGGCLKVNKNNIGDLGKAMGMFSAEDIGIILRAIEEYQKVNSVENEIEENEKNTWENLTEDNRKSSLKSIERE